MPRDAKLPARASAGGKRERGAVGPKRLEVPIGRNAPTKFSGTSAHASVPVWSCLERKRRRETKAKWAQSEPASGERRQTAANTWQLPEKSEKSENKQRERSREPSGGLAHTKGP
jgi:hypothetical protein